MQELIIAVVSGASVASVLGCVAFASDRYRLRKQVENLQETNENYLKANARMEEVISKNNLWHQLHGTGLGSGPITLRRLLGASSKVTEWPEYLKNKAFDEVVINNEGSFYVGLDDEQNVLLVSREGEELAPNCDVPIGYEQPRWTGVNVSDEKIHDLIDALLNAHLSKKGHQDG